MSRPLDLSLAQALADRINLGITLYHLGGDGPESLRLVYANAAADESAGFSFRAHVGETLAEIAPDALETPFPILYAEAARTGERRDVGVFEYGDAHIPQATFDVTAVGLGDRHVAVTYRNIGRQREVEAALGAEREFLSAVLENVQAGIVACDAEGRLTLFNDAAKRFHGLAPDAGLDPDEWASTYSLLQGDGSPMPPAKIPLRRAFQGENVEEAAMQIAPDGLPTRHLLASGRQLRGDDGRSLGAVVVMHDVTERRRAEEAVREAAVAARTADVLRRSEARHRLLVRATASIVSTVGPEGRIEEPLPEWAAFTGQTWDEYRGEGWLSAVHPEDRTATAAAWAAAIASEEPFETEHRLRRHDGAYRWMTARAVPIRDDAGAIAEWVGAHTDVHARREAEAERARREEDFVALADSIPQLVWITGPDGYHQYYNARWYAYTGLSHGETEGEGWNAVLHPDDRERAFAVWRLLARNRPALLHRVPLPPPRRRLPLVSRPGAAAPRPGRRHRALVRHLHRHPRPQRGRTRAARGRGRPAPERSPPPPHARRRRLWHLAHRLRRHAHRHRRPLPRDLGRGRRGRQPGRSRGASPRRRPRPRRGGGESRHGPRPPRALRPGAPRGASGRPGALDLRARAEPGGDDTRRPAPRQLQRHHLGRHRAQRGRARAAPERNPLPRPHRQPARARLDRRGRRLHRLLQPPLVRLHRHHAGGDAGRRLGGRPRPGRAAGGRPPLDALHRNRRAVRDGVPAARRRRRLPLVPDAREPAARRIRRRRALGGHQHQHRRDAADGRGAGSHAQRARRRQPAPGAARRRAHGGARGRLRHARRRAQRHHRPHRRRRRRLPRAGLQRGLLRGL